jgi:predicted AlkP superfamily phosphohydrolase/phosphomutase
MDEKFLVVGWDGAPFSLISELVEAGELPTLERIAEEGYFGPLNTVPYVMSSCAWSTFLTGKNAGKHGVYDFFANEFDEGSYFRQPIDATEREVNELYRILNDHDYSVGMINVPTTYPAPDVGEFFVSGILSPSTDDSRFVSPPDFLDDFDGLDEYQIDLNVGKDDDRDEFLDVLNSMVDNRADLTRYAIHESDDPDFFFTVFTAPDRLSHYFWHFTDEDHPYFATESLTAREKYGDVLVDLFKKLDDELAEIIDAFNEEHVEEPVVAIVSDHGMDSLDRIFFVNKWLRQQGFLTFKKETEVFDNERLASEKEYIFGKVDWENTQAYSVAKAGDIYVNLEGREPEGSVPEEEYESVIRSIDQDLRDYGDPETGEKVIETVERKDEVFTGPHIDKAPDLHITLSNGYYSLGQLYGDRDQVLMTNDDEDLPFVTGIEDGAGILALSGPDIESDEQVQFGLEDFLPTLLYKFGLPVDDDFDGRVVEGLFSDSFCADNPVETKPGGTGTDREDVTTDEGREKVKDRLEDLGYL